MFPKKRKQKEKHISPPKVLKLDLKKTSPPSTPTIGPDSPIIFMPIQSNTPFSSPPPSIPPTPTGDPIISLNTHFSNSRSEVLLLQKLDMLKESMNSSKPSPPEDMFVMPSVVNWSDVPSTSKPSPPEDMFVMPSVVNWSDFPSKSVLTTEDPIDLSRLEEYANLIPSDNWQDIDAITEGAPIIDTADTTQPLAPTNIFTSVFSLEDIISSTILTTNTSLDQDTPLSPSSLIIIPKVIYTPQPTSSPIYLDVSDDDDDDDD
ncbi:MAG: hypothetical protein KFW09_05960, partial [Oscillospiraceae bacterium]|nr:hypothetical protein [Oscillospiraceae bacterium]